MKRFHFQAALGLVEIAVYSPVVNKVDVMVMVHYLTISLFLLLPLDVYLEIVEIIVPLHLTSPPETVRHNSRQIESPHSLHPDYD